MSLKMAGNDINEADVLCEFKEAINNSFLKILDLSHNFIGHLGAKQIALALSSRSVLSKLYLVNCKVGAKGANALFQGCSRNIHLKEL